MPKYPVVWFIPLSTQSVRPPLVAYPWFCSTCVTYGTSCHAIGHQVLPTQPCYCECYGFEKEFFTFSCFLPYIPSCCPQGLSGAGSLPSKVAGLHADRQNIAPAQLLLRMTAIHKRGIVVGSIYVSKASFKVRVPRLPLTGFEPAFLKIPYNDSRLSWRIGHRVLWVLINEVEVIWYRQSRYCIIQ